MMMDSVTLALPCPPRLGTPRNLSRGTLGPLVGRVMAALGLPPTPWQQHVLDVALEVEPRPVYDGQGVLIRTDEVLVYREVRLWVPRQSGKTALLLGLMLHRCLSWSDQRVIYTAQTRIKARDKMVDEHLPLLMRSRLAKRCRVRMTNGSEQIQFPKPKGQLISRWGIDSTTKKAGHGDSLDLVVADEFFAQEDDRLESGARPTMITRSMPQMWFVSTFGDDDEKATIGAPLWRKVDDGRNRARTGQWGAVAYFEWSAADVDDDDIDYGDVELWRRTMPALECNGGIIREDAIRADYESMSLAAFKRAYLNLRPRRHEVVRVFPGSTWGDAVDTGSSLDGGRFALAWDVSPDGDKASVAFAGLRTDGRWHGEVVTCREGTDWLVERVVRAAERAGERLAGIGVLPGATAGALIPEVRAGLEAAGVTVELTELSTMPYAQACGALFNAVKDGQFRHLGQQWLDDAVNGAKRRPAGEAWIWDRKRWSVDITSLCAVTVALRTYQVAPEPSTSVYEDRDMVVLG
jgi:hypothetical protein